jgi:hypothetical protein
MLTDFNYVIYAGTYSWSSIVLGFLYKQLCEACRRTAQTSTQAGCTLLLQLWMWSRLPVGRPRVLQSNPCHDHGNPHLARTVPYLWDVVSPPYATHHRAYLDYTNKIDALVPSTVVQYELFQL